MEIYTFLSPGRAAKPGILTHEPANLRAVRVDPAPGPPVKKGALHPGGEGESPAAEYVKDLYKCMRLEKILLGGPVGFRPGAPSMEALVLGDSPHIPAGLLPVASIQYSPMGFSHTLSMAGGSHFASDKMGNSRHGAMAWHL